MFRGLNDFWKNLLTSWKLPQSFGRVDVELQKMPQNIVQSKTYGFDTTMLQLTVGSEFAFNSSLE
jgi:hypothetical protein